MSRWVALAVPVTFQKGHVVRTAPAGTLVRVDVERTDRDRSDKTIVAHIEWQGVKLVERIEEWQVKRLG
jgi:hypothetical protein